MPSCNISGIVNSKAGTCFMLSSGLRYGNPLSSFLFTLVAHVLGRLVDRSRDVNLVAAGRDSVCVSHLQYADDTIIFVCSKESKVVNLFSVLRIF